MPAMPVRNGTSFSHIGDCYPVSELTRPTIFDAAQCLPHYLVVSHTTYSVMNVIARCGRYQSRGSLEGVFVSRTGGICVCSHGALRDSTRSMYNCCTLPQFGGHQDTFWYLHSHTTLLLFSFFLP